MRKAFVENFIKRGELGGACCAYHRGKKVVDLWGGLRNKQTGESWEQDTMVVVHSASKGLAAPRSGGDSPDCISLRSRRAAVSCAHSKG